MTRSVLVSSILLAGTLAAQAADDRFEGLDPKVQAICRQAMETTLPQPDPTAKVAADCDAYKLYYGIGQPPDYAAARQCALRQLGADDASEAGGGPGLLATIYANGKGVPRNDDLAIAYACRMNAAPAEMEGRIADLTKLKTKGPDKTPFDVCDDTTSGMMEGYCAARAAQIDDLSRKAGLTAVENTLDEPAKAAFTKLESAEQAFVTAVGENEVDMSGTARGAMVVDAEQQHHRAFRKILDAALQGRFADGSFAAADKTLNATYAKVMGLRDTSMLGTVDKKGIKATQKAWLAYRDAFVVFLKAARPSASPEALEADLTRQREKDLAGFLG